MVLGGKNTLNILIGAVECISAMANVKDLLNWRESLHQIWTKAKHGRADCSDLYSLWWSYSEISRTVSQLAWFTLLIESLVFHLANIIKSGEGDLTGMIKAEGLKYLIIGYCKSNYGPIRTVDDPQVELGRRNVSLLFPLEISAAFNLRPHHQRNCWRIWSLLEFIYCLSKCQVPAWCSG